MTSFPILAHLAGGSEATPFRPPPKPGASANKPEPQRQFQYTQVLRHPATPDFPGRTNRDEISAAWPPVSNGSWSKGRSSADRAPAERHRENLGAEAVAHAAAFWATRNSAGASPSPDGRASE